MKNKTEMIGLVSLLLVSVAFLYRTTVYNKAIKGGVEAIVRVIWSRPDPIQALMQTPIEFYGIVLDQNGNPVPAARIEVSVFDNMTKASLRNTTSDAAGKFKIQTKGAGLRIEITKSDYYYVDPGGELKPSIQSFDFGADLGRGINKSDSFSPIIFHLRKAGNPIPLERLRAQPKVPRDGSLISVSLSKRDKINLQIRCRTTEDNTQPPNAPYDWRCEVSIDGGGIQEAKDEFGFLAPEDGYTSSAIIDMPKTLDSKKWNSRANRHYWLRFPDNTLGKVDLMMIAGGDHFAVVNGFRNPSPNDRNLEPKLDAR
ncbi:MAG: carboxypeptidase-like regulatory domain-containing protein [Verrucomicrobia bacterium]|nr:carboxypeptidase-like regulatory domain-containing protein [Verrucomicrobiota bacterium]